MLVSGSKVKWAREQKGKKVAAIATAIDMSATWLYALESKEEPADVKAPLVHALARVLDVKVKDILPNQGA
jgi:transcriptional regulator with XRE-family HTH domain